MVACNLSMDDAALMVRSAASSLEASDRFELFMDLLDLRTPAEVKAFGRACGLRVNCVEVPVEALKDQTHPLHFLTKGLQGH